MRVMMNVIMAMLDWRWSARRWRLWLIRFFSDMIECANDVVVCGVRLVWEQAVVFFGVLAPQVVYYVRSHVVARVIGYHSDHEDAVGFEVMVQEVVEALLSILQHFAH